MKFIGNEYDNYSRCKVDYSDEITEDDEFSQFFVITDAEDNAKSEDTDNPYED